MPSEYFSAIEQSRNTLILVVVFIALCLCFVGLFFYVQKPKKGTIEWIRTYKRGRFEPFVYDPLTYKDVLFFLLTFVVALLLCSLRFFIHYKLGLMKPMYQSKEQIMVTGAVIALFLSMSFYGFFRLFYTSRFVAFLVTCLSCSLISEEIYSVILLLFSWIFFYIWICSNGRNYKRVYFLYFLLAGMFYAFTLMTCWATFYLLPIYVGGCIVGKVVQWHRGDQDRKKGKLLLSLLFLLITGCIGFLLMWLLYYAYKNENMNLLTAALSGDTYYSIVPTFLEKMASITIPHKPETDVVRQDLFRPVLFLFSLIPTLYWGIIKRKSQALTAVSCAVFFLAAWIFAGVDIMCPGAMLSIGWMFKGFRDRGKKRYAVYISLAVLGFYYVNLIV